jgi:hypothetical protein
MPKVLTPRIIFFGYIHRRVYSLSSRYHDGLQLYANWKPHILRPAFIVDGDFNKANLRKTLPKFYSQHIDYGTRSGKTLDHCYTTFRNDYKALPRPPFGKT